MFTPQPLGSTTPSTSVYCRLFPQCDDERERDENLMMKTPRECEAKKKRRKNLEAE